MAGLRLAVRGDERQSMTMRLAMPVASSICSDIEAPSVRSSKPTTPSISDRIGRVNGSHSARRAPRLIWSPSSTLSRAPYCTRCTARSAPLLSTTTIATLRAIAIRSPLELRATLRLRIFTTPSKFELDERLVCELRRAADVEGAHRQLRARLADRLGGDDADRLAHVDRRAARQVAAVAGGADAVRRFAGQHRADLHLLDAGGGDRGRCPPR